jgi:alkanesulfonate monooxygenase SsuD/methylene tetrahydromethanopterin reductase-like flavin-dependent oxidoreductase (luciferase family)
MGGNPRPRGAGHAARFADEYNTVMPTVEQARERREKIAAACEAAGRDPLPFSIMTMCVIGADEAEVRDRSRRLGDVPEAALAGTVEQVAERLDEYAQVGVERVMLQHLLHRDLDAVELIGRLT